MKLELISDAWEFTWNTHPSKKEKVRIMNRARNFLKNKIDKLEQEIIREAIAKSGQISIDDVIKEEENNQNL